MNNLLFYHRTINLANLLAPRRLKSTSVPASLLLDTGKAVPTLTLIPNPIQKFLTPPENPPSPGTVTLCRNNFGPKPGKPDVRHTLNPYRKPWRELRKTLGGPPPTPTPRKLQPQCSPQTAVLNTRSPRQSAIPTDEAKRRKQK